MAKTEIRQLSTLEQQYFDQTLTLLINSFYSMFKKILKDKEVLCRLFAPCMQQDLFYVRLEGDVVAGLIAVSNLKRRAIEINQDVCISVFGKIKGKLFASQLSKILSEPEVNDSCSGYVDFLATNQNYRRKGVGASLLTFLKENMGYTDLYLDVLASNAPAISLYTKMGYEFVRVKKNILMRLAGIGKMYVMKKVCIEAVSDDMHTL